MRLIFTTAFILAFTAAQSQSIAPPVIWQHCYGGSLDDIGYGISATSDDGFIFCGCSGSNDGNIFPVISELHGGTCDYWFAKIDADSNIQFKVHLGGTQSDVARTVLETMDGNYIVGGAASSNDVDITDHKGPAGNPDFWVVKVNSSGGVLWKKSYGSTGYDDFGSMILTPDGGYALCGGTQPNSVPDNDVTTSFGSSDFWLVKLDASNAIQWQKSYGGSDYEKAFDVKLCQDGGYLLAGFTGSNDGEVSGNHNAPDYDGWVVKTNASGDLQWQKCLGGNSTDLFYHAEQLEDGNFLLAGFTNSNDGDLLSLNHGSEDAWLVLLDPAGNLLWSKAYGGDSVEEFSSVEQDKLGGIIVSGYSKSHDGDLSVNYGDWDYWLAEMDENGNILWDSTYGGPFSDVCNDFAIANDGRVAMLGYTTSDSIDVSGNHGVNTSNHPYYPAKKDYWVLDLGSVVGIDEVSSTNLSVIPNLAHDVIQLSSDDLRDAVAEITVRNMSGQVVLNDRMEHKTSGLFTVSPLPPGMYILEVQSAAFSAVTRFIKM